MSRSRSRSSKSRTSSSGTFDKSYDEITGKLDFKDTHIQEMLRLGRSRVEVAAPGQQEPVELGGQLAHGRGRELGRQRDRDASGLLHRVQVRRVDVRALRMRAHRDGRAHADEGRAATHGAMLPYRP